MVGLAVLLVVALVAVTMEGEVEMLTPPAETLLVAEVLRHQVPMEAMAAI
jgi:hypothetical protein